MSDEPDASSSSSLADPEISHARKTVKSYGISIDASKIHEVAYEEQPESLRELGVNIFDQDVFEEGVLQQVDEAIAAQEEALEKQRLEKDLKTVEEELRTEHQISKTRKNQQANKLLVLDHEKLERKKEYLLQRLGITKDVQDSPNEEETSTRNERKESELSDEDSAERLLQIRDHQETEVEHLIRLGEMTPFGSIVSDDVVQIDTEEVSSGQKKDEMHDKVLKKDIHVCHSDFEDKASTSEARTESLSVVKSHDGVYDNEDDNDYCFDDCLDEENDDNAPQLDSDDDYIPDDEELKLSWGEELMRAEHTSTQHTSTQSEKNVKLPVRSKKKKKHKSKPMKKTGRLHRTTKDDGDDTLFQKRIREVKLKKILREKGIDYAGKSDEEEESWDEDCADEEFEGGLKIPGAVWNKLFRYQKTGVKWLWELHCQQAGGIVGDEMGLGKTIQLIAFLAGLKYSKIGRRTSKQAGLGPVLIVCPATVIYQWVAEFHKWWPEFRVAVLHDTGSYQGPKDVLINKIRNTPGVLITTYSGTRLNQEHLLPSRWDYVILDEGHTIRNPDAEITLACKQFRTAHRIVLSGCPMQNNLRELWSLFDFVFPGKLGTLPVFMQEFSVPITMGGYANATQVQVQTAYKCACVLRDTINPYLLRRLKKDVKMKLGLPNKNEQVLFCRLTEEQTEIYKGYLASREVGSILSGSMKVFAGLIMLRKICNHPDLTSEAGSLWKLKKDEEKAETGQALGEDSEYGYWKRSGKFVVVHSLLKLWKKQKHKVLLFTQSRQMLKIFEIFVKSQGYVYCRMDGSTSISSRQPLIERFNKEKSIFVFLLTTRVGGLGVNLVGANRVIIYDPDWNPGTDMQAKERAWRVGQKKDVTIYRLLTTGTIEEKIYHRQIFKQFLTNRVLKDPKQRRFFKSNDLFELFTLDTSDNTKTGTETGAIFAGLGCEVKLPSSQKKGTKRKNHEPLDSASIVKMMKEKTKEILKAQFSHSKETVALTNDDSHKNLNVKDNDGSSREKKDNEGSSRDNDGSSRDNKNNEGSPRDNDGSSWKNKDNDGSSREKKDNDGSSRDNDGSSWENKDNDGLSRKKKDNDGSPRDNKDNDGWSWDNKDNDGSSQGNNGSSRENKDNDGSFRDNKDNDGSCMDNKDNDGSCMDNKDNDGSCMDNKDNDGSYMDNKDNDGSFRDNKDNDGSSRENKYDDGAFRNNKDNDGSSRDNSGSSRNNNDTMTTCDQKKTGEHNDCVEQLSGEGSSRRGLCDNRETGSNSEFECCSTEDLLEGEGKYSDVARSEKTSSVGIEDATKMKRKKDKGKMKSKKKRKRNNIEGIRIGQLSHSEPYVSKKDSEDGENNDDQYILRKLFQKSGVHSALQHDTIVDSGNSDHILVENEAQRVAAQAAEALKRSRERCMLDRGSGLPTWTGQSGFVGSPFGVPKKTLFGPKAKAKTKCKEDASEHFSGESLLGKAEDETKATSSTDPMSSTQLLARMRARNFIDGNNAGSEVPSSEHKYEETVAEMREFIASRCSRAGMATTREILEEFCAKLPVSDSAIFRSMLRTICDFERGVSGEGYWILKSEF